MPESTPSVFGSTEPWWMRWGHDGDLPIVMGHVAQLPLADVRRLAEGPHPHSRLDCTVCDVLKHDDYPNDPGPERRDAWRLVQWHQGTSSADMYARCLVVYMAARLRLAEERNA